MPKTNTKATKQAKPMGPASRVVTLNIHRALKDYRGKFRAPRAIREMKKLALKEMGTEKVTIAPSLNVGLWQTGMRNVPNKLRLRITRKADDSEEGAGGFVSEIDIVQVADFRGLSTEKEA